MTLAERIQAVLGGLVVFLVTYTLAERAERADAARAMAELDLGVTEAERDYWRGRADDPTGAPIVYGLVALAGLLLGLGIAIVIGL